MKRKIVPALLLVGFVACIWLQIAVQDKHYVSDQRLLKYDESLGQKQLDANNSILAELRHHSSTIDRIQKDLAASERHVERTRLQNIALLHEIRASQLTISTKLTTAAKALEATRRATNWQLKQIRRKVSTLSTQSAVTASLPAVRFAIAGGDSARRR